MKHEKKYGKRSCIGIASNGRKERPARVERTLAVAERQPVSNIPRQVTARILAEPKNKLTAKQRRRVMRSREFIVVPPKGQGLKSVHDKTASRVAKMTMTQLVRKVTQCPHRIQKAKSILEDLSPDSSFAPGLRNYISVIAFVLSTVEAEIKRRVESPAIRDTRTPRIRKWDAIKNILKHRKA